MKSILSVVPARTSFEERIKAPWRALPIEFVELSRAGTMGIEYRSGCGEGGEIGWTTEGAVGSWSPPCSGKVEFGVWDLVSTHWSAKTPVQDRDSLSPGRGRTGWAVTESTVWLWRS